VIQKGDKVRILPEFADVGDEQFERIALEDEDGGRVRIVCLVPGLAYQPQEVLDTRMLEVVQNAGTK
jgi:hypothetical protein